MYYNYEYAVVTAINDDPNWNDIAIEEIFSRSRKKELVLARRILMYYRTDVLKKSQAVSASRYGRDHATCLSSNRKFEFFMKQYPEYKALYDKFLSLVDAEFTGKLYKIYKSIEGGASELYSLSCALDGTFETHEAAMLKYNEVESHLVEFKKLILEKWKTQ
jgi:hypothetical protein